MPSEERAVVVAREEARLLALGAVCSLEAGLGRLCARLGLRLLTEREPDPPEVARVESGEHVALVLRRVGSARKQKLSFVLDAARALACRGPRGPDAVR